MKNEIEELKLFLTSEKRVCPIPIKWRDLTRIIFEKGERAPPSLTPLILNGWSASDLRKRERLLAQIDFVSTNKKEKFEEVNLFLKNLKQEDWLYGSEPLSDDEID